jgi:hypothetical protein
MKKWILIWALLLPMTGLQAQDKNNIFSHLGGSVGLGTTGVTIDLSTNITDFVGVRAGVDIMSNLKFKDDLDILTTVETQSSYNQWAAAQAAGSTVFPNKVKFEGKFSNTSGHVLIDLYPYRNVGFRVTVGAYFAPSEVMDVYNLDDAQLLPVANYNQWAKTQPNAPVIGAQLGDYLFTPDANGHVDAKYKVKGFRPYLGLGWGRGVPRKSVLAFSVDLGVQFWGKPEVLVQGNKLDKSDFGGGGDFLKAMSEITVYPVISFRLNGKFF